MVVAAEDDLECLLECLLCFDDGVRECHAMAAVFLLLS